MAEKRSRNQNWSQNENSLLKNLVMEYDSILSMKHSNDVTNKKKKEIWDYIKNPNKPTRSLQADSGGSEK